MVEKGGDAALASYGGDPAAVPQAHIDWLDRLRLTHVDAHRLYVHAGVEPEMPLDRQSETTLLWKRYPKGNRAASANSTSCTATTMIPKARYCTGPHQSRHAAWRTGRLTVGVFDDDRPGGPVDLIEVEDQRPEASLACAVQAFEVLLGHPIRHVRR